MITLKTKEQIELMKKAGEILAACHREIAGMIRPGITTQEIDQFAEAFMKKNGATPEQKGYNGYQYATCASVNDVICHGFPGKYVLQDGDIVTIDMVVNLNGWLADSAWSYAVGQVTPEAQHLLDVTKTSLYKGIELAVIGNRIGDISNAIQTYAEGEGLSVVREFIGHGIGEKMHEEPQVPHYGPPHRGPRLKEGMVITIEPMLNIGTYRSKLDSDGWTARTQDGSLSAQYEHTIAITADGPVILTAQ
ncbi:MULTISPECIES: type I methionyl aminopeptidase [Paenibacillus]|jgi:methionyl aminopeptidase|uniref:Methionine aminopeptidase n=2 Tax=Paenibacillus TaxID=44249 RepID=A0A2V3S268_9BACL|nr:MULTISPECIES: type I methionyl aminopeptidase [Paenibacillus]MCZ1263828.1 type I methionyl aminopeptidase [Paenibacillus tundrae]MDR9748426.1 type I methionyl aminopeptidase [Paenibacillus taichungensis]MEC0105681.1 type I methionyl aminopeptidase [Paenibacillus taichungensis]MEC0198234.1 type I methionyl aminopeptidase [Paenibacillus taichungensis]NEU63118.1 type I methionyl aminopeptidase [Paenibacillus sp. ALJ109b]